MFPVRARLLRVTQKVSSNSIHTLLCSDEHRNPPSGRLRENRFQPQHKAERFVLSLGCKAEASETTFQKTKPPNVTIPTTPRHFRQKLYNRYFRTVETNVRPSGWTAEGRQEQTDKQPNNPNGIRTSVGSDIGLLGEISVRFYGSARINVPHCIPAIVSKSSFSMRPARRQTCLLYTSPSPRD